VLRCVAHRQVRNTLAVSNYMRKVVPKGLFVFSIILMIVGVWTISIFFTDNPHMIFFGKIFSGLPFQIYYSGLGILFLIIAVGIFKLKRWTYVSFMVLTAYFILISVMNIVLTNYETLLKVGWKLSDNNMSSFVSVQQTTLSTLGGRG
jgi:hypothetical protein